jgi:beta-N-acetylhexosaminidase
MKRKAIIFGIKGQNLSLKEKKLFSRFKPWGIILFSRNIKNLEQLKHLIFEIKKIFNDKNYPILIDEEGGIVSRLNKIIDFSVFSNKYFSQLYKKNKKLFFIIYNIYTNIVCELFADVGININTVPVLDVRRKNSHSIIAKRSFSNDPKQVSLMGNICINSFAKHKIATVMKHIPGHGLSNSDSHHRTPIIKNKIKELINKDFKTFKECNPLFAMTAQLIYAKYDSKNTATHSHIVINKIIRNHINFRGILISDDISMKALKYNFKENATRALKAGCNIVLHCNGKLNEMKILSKIIPNIDSFTQKKTSQFYKFLM